MTVSIKQAQIQLAELINRSSGGEEIVIENEGGQAVARIVPEPAAPRRRGSVLGIIGGLPERTHTSEDWAQIEQELQRERDAWER